MIILLGKTASGKDTVLNRLVKEHGYKKIVTYTTRPKREREIQDVTYHFIGEDEFKEKIESGFFLEYKEYRSAHGTWYYGSAKEDYEKSDEKTVIILTPDGYRDFLREYPNMDHTSIYLYSNNKTLENRLIKRGDDPKEAKRRLDSDNKDFKGVQGLVHKIVYNNENDSLDEVINKILKYVTKKIKVGSPTKNIILHM